MERKITKPKVKITEFINYMFNFKNFLSMKKFLFMAAALVAMASCSNNDYFGDSPTEALANGQGLTNEISFGLDVPYFTRVEATGATAAGKLGSQFIVWGEKSEPNTGAAGTMVFNNYQVNYVDGTANSTMSNTKGWEYVGYTHSAEYQANITNSYDVAQTIKYWDYSATNYVFTAVSAKGADITDGKVKITKTTSGTTVYDKGYSIVLTADADLTKLYFSDRQVIAQGTGTNRNAVNAYGGNATLKFRNVGTYVRVGMYETVPGYSVKIDKFYYVDAAAPTFPTMTSYSETNFAANVPNTVAAQAQTLTVKYHDNSVAALENQPTITSGATAANYITLGTGINDATSLAEVSNAPTYDNASYTVVIPQESNDKDMFLKVDYTLKSTDGSNETIKVTGATARVPYEFLQWKPNYKYTYIFKISQDTNGSTGGDVVGLYPITFDAVVVDAGDGLQETITTLTRPSITTYAKGAVANEYNAGSNIYVVVNDGGNVALNTKTKLYTVTIEANAAQTINEASVANALVNGTESPTGTWTVTDAKGKHMVVTAAAGLSYTNAIPVTDAPGVNPGNTAISFGDNKVAKFTPAAAATYVFEYRDGSGNKHYKIIKVQ